MADQHEPHETESLVGSTLGPITVGSFIVGGAMGSFHRGEVTTTQQYVLIKFEKKDCHFPHLQLEHDFNLALGPARFIPKMYYFGWVPSNELYLALVTDPFGESLDDMRQKCGGRFGLQTTTQIMIQLIEILEYVHERGILLRNIRPDITFIVGPAFSPDWWTVNLSELYFCKHYLVQGTNQHIPFGKAKRMIGTANYMSISCHAGNSLARRDDCEAILYMAVFLHKGKLPWEHLDQTNGRSHCVGFDEMHSQMGAMKANTPPEELCKDMPQFYLDFMNDVKKLSFEERPPYHSWLGQLHQLLTSVGTSMEQMEYDWDECHNLVLRYN